ncbi:MAG: immunoglobulin domain-containing protein, partial [Verrucomicrobiota bacterium]
VNTNADSGTNCLVLSWQFKDVAAADWLRATFQGTGTGATPNPIVDLTKPITIRFLVLPVGTVTNRLTLTSVPVSQTKSIGQSVTFSAAATGEGPFTYQWQFASANITGETSSSYTKNNLQESDAGVYSVVITGAGGTGCSATNSATLTVPPLPPTITYSADAGTITLSWVGSFTLQSAPEITGPWSDVTSTSPYSESDAVGTKFFRLRN